MRFALAWVFQQYDNVCLAKVVVMKYTCACIRLHGIDKDRCDPSLFRPPTCRVMRRASRARFQGSGISGTLLLRGSGSRQRSRFSAPLLPILSLQCTCKRALFAWRLTVCGATTSGDQHDMTSAVKAQATQLYPKRYFDASRTWFEWNKLTSKDVFALREEGGFEGES